MEKKHIVVVGSSKKAENVGYMGKRQNLMDYLGMNLEKNVELNTK